MDLVANSTTLNKKVVGSRWHLAQIRPLFSLAKLQVSPKNNTKTDNWFPISDISKLEQATTTRLSASNKRSWTTSTSPPSADCPKMERWAAAPKSVGRESSAKSAAPVLPQDQNTGMLASTDPLSQETWKWTSPTSMLKLHASRADPWKSLGWQLLLFWFLLAPCEQKLEKLHKINLIF